ncbi:branched-chain amino acid aminotransferase [Lentzea flaviverrucosa]|uniref:Branched-chain-amino-acid aminotransferase n=1 Tax=Lentzea flaviverrucosa TaxID=200379 RepID=A0A1H9XLW9_9PSEU|nr:branched-chain amino acid aminotransferase [Lentzea flaviverrucosa]RDI20429.1 branched-chain amino acid aminotransferase [Lentzea flaviverrucosa]SES47091.1 branched-chain amino acid aminotransferase [Lentzea flaviverrucosa]
MTSELPFTRTPHPHPATPERVAEVLAKPGFGQHFTDHMVTIRWNREKGWHDAEVGPYSTLALDPAAMVLHYGQAIFEGLKAYRQPDGSIASFRPEANAERFRASARRMAMPELPDELFLESVRQILAVDDRWVPSAEEESLYLRPFMISTEKGLGVRPSSEYLYVLIASPAGSYFAGGVRPVSVWLSTEYVRAAPGGTGAAKFAGNYAASLVAQAQAAEKGCDQVVWLDAVERRWVEEMGGMNLFFVFGDKVITPELTGTLLPGITRNSLLALASDLGLSVEERRISTDEWEKANASGELTEVFACGTAAVITPVGHVKHAGGEFDIADGGTGPVTKKLRESLTGLQHGHVADTHGWMTTLKA